MSAEARNVHLRTIWRYQHSLNTTRAALLSKISDEEHFRFVTMFPLPPADKDEVTALMPPASEVLDKMRSEGIGSGGWDARDEVPDCQAEPMDVDPPESDTDDEFSYNSDEPGDFTDSSGEEEEGVGLGGGMEGWTVSLGNDICEDQNRDVDVGMEKEDEDSGVESCEWDDSAGSSESSQPSSPEDDCLVFPHDAKDTDPTKLESPTSPVSSDYSDSDPKSSPRPPNAIFTNGDREHYLQGQHPENAPTTIIIPPFSFAALNSPTTTAETLFAFEAAYTDVYNSGAYVWHFSRVQEHRRYEAFQMGCHRRKAEVSRRGPSKLRNEVLPENLEEAGGWGVWGDIEPRRGW